MAGFGGYEFLQYLLEMAPLALSKGEMPVFAEDHGGDDDLEEDRNRRGNGKVTAPKRAALLKC